MSRSVCRKGKFSLDDSPSWDGYTFGQTWNGFACPYFELKEAKEIAAFCYGNESRRIEKSHWRYDPAHDQFVMWESGDDEKYVVEGEHIDFNGKTIKVYGIGNFAWVWSEDDEPLRCASCNTEIEPGDNYLEAKPLRPGGAVGIFCSSVCAGNFFVERMCVSKAHTTE